MPGVYNIKAEEIKSKLAVKDDRSVVKRLEEIGVPIYRRGRHRYVIEEEIIQALRQARFTSYRAKSKLSEI